MEYRIEGANLPVVTCYLNNGESMMSQAGAMCWMSPNIKMETIGGGFGKAIGRMFSGESLFLNRYSSSGQGMVAFASNVPGSIRAIPIQPGQDIIVQKSSFLAMEPGVELSVHLQKRLGAGLFGGEGFIMQRLSGRGMAFLEIDGSAVEFDLQPGQQMIIDTGYLAVCSATCTIDIVTVPGMKNVLFGGEGLFNTVVTGPGHIILQSMPISKLAGAVGPFVSSS
ncbi:MAG TPA: AIM24 family protein [Clostridiaceae bacterium]|nr:AIM24 family protein [Clostridiaceae bacterium]